MFISDLNQQKIAEFFENDTSKQQSIIRKDQISLNFTVTSRQSKNQQKSKNCLMNLIKINKTQPQNVINLAMNQLEKFNAWNTGCNQKNKRLLENLNELSYLTQNHKKIQPIPISDFQLLKRDILNNRYNSNKVYCQQCKKNRQLLSIYKNQYQQRMETLQQNYLEKISKIKNQYQQQFQQYFKKSLLDDVQLNIYKEQNIQSKDKIKNLILQNQKFNLQRSTLFSKTKNLQEKLKIQMQKSKGMSATKNSITGGDSLHRPDSFLFDNDTDIDQWIHVFTFHTDTQKTKCRKIKVQYQNRLGNKLDSQQRQNLYNGPNFLLYKKYQNILKQLTQVKQLKIKYNIQIPKISLRQQRNSNNLFNNLKDPIWKGNDYSELYKQIKQLKMQNKCLQNQKRNLQQSINQIRQNFIDKKKNQQLIQQLNQKVQKLQQQIIQLNKNIKQYQQQYNIINQNYLSQNKKIKFLQKKLQDLTSKKQSLEIQNKDLQFKLNKQKLDKKKLINIQDIKGSIKIYCRIRPKLKNQHCYPLITKVDNNIISIDKGKQYQFDSIFKENSKQQEIFQDCKNLIQNAFDGYNVCVFTYGQTGSGKTYTLHGYKQNPGLAPRMIEEIFKIIQSQKNYYNCIVEINLVEIYFDNIFDMLGVVREGSRLEVKQDPDGYVYIHNCPRVRVNNVQDMLDAYYGAIQKRKTVQTQQNSQSSRSHCVFMIRLELQNKKTKQKKQSKISLIDLAGSQKNNNTSNFTQQKQTNSINLSLSSLTKVLNALKNQQKCIPYRQNKLTYLLKDSLTSKSKILMIVNISPGENNRIQTISSLEFGMKVSQIQKVQKKEDKGNSYELKTKIRRSISCLSDL